MYRHADILENGLPIVHIGKLMHMAKRSERERSAFGRRMLLARERAGLTQTQVRDALKLAQSTLSELEGPALTSGRTVEFAALYGCDPRWLATGEGSPGWGKQAPAAPPADFHDRHIVNESDWARLQELRDMESSPALARRLEELRAELAERKQFAENVYRRRIEEAQAHGGHAGGMSVFGGLDEEAAAPPAPAKKRKHS